MRGLYLPDGPAGLPVDPLRPAARTAGQPVPPRQGGDHI